MLPEVSITKMMYSLSTGMPPMVSLCCVRALLRQQPLHFLAELLVGRPSVLCMVFENQRPCA